MSKRSYVIVLGTALVALGIVAAGFAIGTRGGGGEDGTTAEVVMSSSGCGASTVRVPAAAARMIRVVNEAQEPMVLSVPTISLAVAVPAGGRAEVALHRYISGDYSLYCVPLLVSWTHRWR